MSERSVVARPTRDELHEIEKVAVELATLAGAEIVRTLGGIFRVRYKSGQSTDKVSLSDPVSEVDGRIEQLIRSRLAERFSDHDIIGEEMPDRPARGHDFVWAVDPIDGTTNFVNGFPVFAASIGVLHRGRPVVGAIWSSISHALRPGVYHATEGGTLRFEGDDVTPKLNPTVRRRLAGMPVTSASAERDWETRKTGSAAVECALVSAGLMEVARFSSPNIWDVAAGLAMLRSAGCDVRRNDNGRWTPMDCFLPIKPGDHADLRYWRDGLVVGAPHAVESMCAATERG
jgi:myo-inositol-1(or 4)-monophosphatase